MRRRSRGAATALASMREFDGRMTFASRSSSRSGRAKWRTRIDARAGRRARMASTSGSQPVPQNTMFMARASAWASNAIIPGMFELTEQQQALVETCREFAAREIVPVAGKLDEHGTFPKEILEKAWGLGLVNCEIPEAYGGAGLS